MKKDRYDILDFTEKHTLSELECELVTFFRILPKTRQQIVMQMLFGAVMTDKKVINGSKKLKEAQANEE